MLVVGTNSENKNFEAKLNQSQLSHVTGNDLRCTGKPPTSALPAVNGYRDAVMNFF